MERFIRIVSKGEMRQIEKQAFTTFALTESLIIENVGWQAARVFNRYCPKDIEDIVILMGKGNNAADALACARHLFHKRKISGKSLRLHLMRADDDEENYSVELKKQVKMLKALGDFELKKFPKAFAVIDGLFGLGFKGPLAKKESSLIKAIQEANPTFVYALDIPSGVEADTGRVEKNAVALSAHITLAIGCPKWGHYLAEGPAHRGKLIIIDGGFPLSLLEGEDEGLIPKKRGIAPKIRKAFAHKNDFGHVLLVGGSPGLSGAPLLCAQAAQAMGVGLLTLLTGPEAYKELCWRSHDLLSIMLAVSRRKALNSFSAIAVGPGLGTSPDSERILREILEELVLKGDSEKKLSLILDADALNLLARNKALLELFANCKNTFKLITPHLGEMASLLNMTDCKNEILTQEGLCKVKEFARRNECFVLLKNAISFLCGPDEKVFILDAPNSGLAKGGSGDVLCGMILGLMGLKVQDAQTTEAIQKSFVENCVEGMLFHSRMGKIAKNKWGEQVMQPQDLVSLTNN